MLQISERPKDDYIKRVDVFSWLMTSSVEEIIEELKTGLNRFEGVEIGSPAAELSSLKRSIFDIYDELESINAKISRPAFISEDDLK